MSFSHNSSHFTGKKKSFLTPKRKKKPKQKKVHQNKYSPKRKSRPEGSRKGD